MWSLSTTQKTRRWDMRCCMAILPNSRNKYPNSVHWHFKREPKKPDLLVATFWDVKSLFWLMIRHREPKRVKEAVPLLLSALKQEIEAYETR